MRSISIMRSALCLALALAGCGGASSQSPAPASAPAAASPDSTEGTATPAEGAAGEGSTAGDQTAPALSATALGPQIGGGSVRFNFKPDFKPKKLYLAGNFNDWNPSNSSYLLSDEDGDGIYSITIKLGPGKYQYKFVIDGQWLKDPNSPGAAPDGFGGQNGAFEVK